MPLHLFYEHTPRQFLNYLKGVRFRESENHKATMEQTRWLAMYSILPHHDAKKHGKLKPTDIFQFPWDENKPHAKEIPQKQQIEEAKKRWAKIGSMRKKELNG